MLVTLSFFTFSCSETALPDPDKSGLTAQQELGKLLFFDKMLSTPPGQSCASCHDPGFAFANPNPDLPVSQGAERTRFGSRNDLTAMYTAYIPALHFDEKEGMYIGGLFWDGRVNSLEDQAKRPPLNHLEMANPDIETIVAALRKAPYVDLFKNVFGENSLDNPDTAYNNFAAAIAAYERSAELNPFSSKYDYFVKGQVTLSAEEMRGLSLFNDPVKGNCAACHPGNTAEDGTPALFTDFSYDNLGVPKNPVNPFYYLSKELNPDGTGFVDLGLGSIVGKSSENGKFRVPTMRNVAKTAPYMHNGVFQTLYEVITFYNTRDIGPWPDPEVKQNVNTEELGKLGLSEQEITDLIAFLETLNDGYQPD
jgi:cytochrome c peroxidase